MKRLFATFMLLLVMFLASCNLPTQQKITPTSQADAILTAAAQTVEVQLTRGVNMPTPGPTLAQNTPQPTAPQGDTPQPSPTNTNVSPQPTNTPEVCDRGEFVDDITILDGTVLSPGDQFTKTWRLKNTGTCTWTTSYATVFDHENLMGAQTIVALTRSVAPGETVDISVTMTAPNTPGTYKGYWMLRNDKGVVFGLGSKADKPFYVDIQVAAAYFAVTGVIPSVVPSTFEGVCNPAKLTFKADIRVNKAGTIKYHWKFSDSADSPVFELTFTEAGTKTVSYDLEITKAAGQYTGWGDVYNDDPNHQEFSKINYTLKCQ